MKLLIHKILSISFFLFVVASAMAQERRAQILQAKIASGNGSVRTLDNEIVQGKVTFNDNQGIVTVEYGRESRSFTSKNAIGF